MILMTKKTSIPEVLRMKIPARMFISFFIWSKLAKFTYKIYRKFLWKQERVDIAIHNHMNQQFRSNQQRLQGEVSYPPKK
jgi:hypothetical protein